MRKGWKFPLAMEVVLGTFLLVLLIGACMLTRAVHYGFSAHDKPTAMEAFMAGRMRHWSIPADLHKMTNPLPLTPEVLSEALAHYADHCATCHGNDGKGHTEMGQHLYPKTPDMTLAETQSLSDGEIFATIENGVRMTGMPGWGEGTAESAYGSWTLVHFIRHLPQLTTEEIGEMEKLNPKSPDEYAEMKSEESFLAGSDASESPHHETHHH
jgi:cytochrome c553